MDRSLVACSGAGRHRWRVIAVDTEHNRIAAHRLTDGARAAFSGDYLHENITHGYAITVHSAQGATADTTHAVIGQNTSCAMLYVAMTRGRDTNSVYLYERIAGEGDHEHNQPDGFHILRRGTNSDAAALLRNLTTGRDQRPQTVHQVAATIDPQHLPGRIARLSAQRAAAVHTRRAAHTGWHDTTLDQHLQRQHWIDEHPHRGSDKGLDYGSDL